MSYSNGVIVWLQRGTVEYDVHAYLVVIEYANGVIRKYTDFYD